MNTPVEVVFAVPAALGEGPVWDEEDQTLIWLDIENPTLYRGDLNSGGVEAVRLDRTVGAVALRNQGPLVAAVPEGFADLDATGRVDVIASVPNAGPRLRMNDGKCAPDGSFFAGLMNVGAQPGDGTLYRLAPDHSVRTVLTGLTIPNGIDWTADGGTGYFVDTPTQRIDRLMWHDDGRLERIPFVSIDKAMGVPDGLTVDTEGNVWIALCFGGRVLGFAPDARQVAEITVPTALTTSVTFGGPTLDLLLITTGRADGTPIEELTSGCVFGCRPGFIGQPARRFRG